MKLTNLTAWVIILVLLLIATSCQEYNPYNSVSGVDENDINSSYNTRPVLVHVIQGIFSASELNKKINTFLQQDNIQVIKITEMRNPNGHVVGFVVYYRLK